MNERVESSPFKNDINIDKVNYDFPLDLEGEKQEGIKVEQKK